MSKSSLIAVLALIASASAKPNIYSYGTLPYTAPRAAYTDFYYSAVAPLTAYSAAGYPAAYSLAYSTTHPASYSAAPSGAQSAPLTLPSFYGSSYAVDELASPVNPAPVAPVSPVASLVYVSPYSYYYKR